MNQEYRKKVFFEDIVFCTFLLWGYIKCSAFMCNLIWALEDRTPNFVRQLRPKKVVYRFTRSGNNSQSLLPQNYFYSSGLNDPNGYK
jgi:hypothetical protein